MPRSSNGTTSARALAARRNGAKSRGPKTAAGKARSSRNAIKHGLCATEHVLLDEEDAAAFARLEVAARAELAPVGDFQADLVGRVVAATWRARRADRLEAALLELFLDEAGAAEPPRARAALGHRLVRDGNGPRALDTLVRYRGSALTELFRALGALRVLRTDAGPGDDAAPPDAGAEPLPSPAPETKRTRESEQNQCPRSR